jgi:hypothetical protein
MQWLCQLLRIAGTGRFSLAPLWILDEYGLSIA